MSDPLDIPPFLRRAKDEPKPVIPADAPELTEGLMSGLGFTSDPVNMRKETAGERSKRHRDEDRAYLFAHKTLQKSSGETLRGLTRISEENHDDPIPKPAIAHALRRLKREKLVVSEGKWYRWRS